jgi:transcriptional regulator with XRE-family HTH domain
LEVPEAPSTLGERVRRLRQERGLSLAKVVRGDFSRAFLNQVEMGKARPSPRLLGLIAARLGTSPEYLLEGSQPLLQSEITVERARLLLAQGHPRRALNEVQALLESTEWPLGSDARLCAAQALIELGDAERARALAEVELDTGAAWLDEPRLKSWEAIRAGRARQVGAGDPDSALREHARTGDRLLREGRPLAALEHYRAARAIAEAIKPR